MVSRTLMAGVWLSGALCVLGLVLMCLHPGAFPDLSRFDGAGHSWSTPRDILRGAIDTDPFAIAQLGVVCLVLTPIARVALALVAFVTDRDRLYAGISLVVLALLAVGFFTGLAH
jgi:uncharacterized membrane protein